MRDKFIFSNAQDLTGLNSTGVVGTNIWDIEEDAVTDGQLTGFVNFLFGASNAGATQGLYVEVRTSDNTDITTGATLLGSQFLTDAELTAAAGKEYTVGFERANLLKYVGVWYRAHTTSLAGTATPVDAYFSPYPASVHGIQKKPV